MGDKPRGGDQPANPMDGFASVLDSTPHFRAFMPKTIAAAFAGGSNEDARVPASHLVRSGQASLLQRARALEAQIASLNATLDQQREALRAAQSDAQQNGQQQLDELKNLRETQEKLAAAARLQFLTERVNERAQAVLLDPDSTVSEVLVTQFESKQSCDAFVMSVDIRRSTELMLKAKDPQAFATFIEALYNELTGIVKDRNGVMDKFTGDGILAFFPLFFSGADAGFQAVAAAEQCHQAFTRLYKACRPSFTSVPLGAGLGIGIDFGPTRLVKLGQGLTVVGVPVVYACRLSGAPAGKTYLNQQAYEWISRRSSSACFFEETKMEVKHEDTVLAYSVTLNGRQFRPAAAIWEDDEEEGDSSDKAVHGEGQEGTT